MTDEEIKKAFECCIVESAACDDCPNKNTCDEIDVAEKVLDLINRQQAEIERLEAKFNEYPVKTLLDENNMMLSKSSEDYDKWFWDIQKDISYHAIKEFAERLKEKSWIGMWETVAHVDVDEIDNLVKEMTEVETNQRKEDDGK